MALRASGLESRDFRLGVYASVAWRASDQESHLMILLKYELMPVWPREPATGGAVSRFC